MSTILRLLGGMAVAGVLLGTTAGCGGDDAAAPAPKSSGARQTFQECLKEKGVTMPERGSGSGRPSRPAGAQEAFQACASLAPSGRPGAGGMDQSALKAYRTCLSEKGVKVAANRRPSDLATGDPKIAKALEVCRPVLPTRSPSGRPTG